MRKGSLEREQMVQDKSFWKNGACQPAQEVHVEGHFLHRVAIHLGFDKAGKETIELMPGAHIMLIFFKNAHLTIEVRHSKVSHFCCVGNDFSSEPSEFKIKIYFV